MELSYLQDRRVACLDRARRTQQPAARMAHIAMARFYAEWIDREEAQPREPGGER